MTLVELLVVIALLGVIAGVGGLATRHARPVNGVSASAAAALVFRDSALRSGRVVTGIVLLARADARAPGAPRRPIVVTAYPDGRLLSDSALGIDPMSGGPAYAAR